MSICYPSDTDWSCAYDAEKLTEMRAVPETLAKMELAEAQAWYSLAMLTAWRIGVCPTLVRPVASCHFPGGSWMAAPVSGGGHVNALPIRSIGALNVTPYVTGGQWVNACGCGPSLCGHDSMRTLTLPGPVGEIEWVKIDGIVVESTKYRVDNGNLLVSLDPDLVWPGNQNLHVDPDAVGSFAISYYQGAAPDAIIRAGAGVLATEFYKACVGDKACRLPRNLTRVTRGGATYDVAQGLFVDGLTRIPEADLVIRLYNPNLLKQAPRIVTPESRNRSRRTTLGRW